MKARVVALHETGGPEALRLEVREIPEPGAGEVRVRIAAAGVNFIDVYFRTGLYPRELPCVLGLEGAGVVEAVGDDVESLAEGDRVAWASAPDSYAEWLVAPAAGLVPVPDGVSDALAAAAMLQGMTAHYLVHATRETREKDVALVHAAAGGVGLLLVQMLKGSGATVIGTCSSEEKERLVREAGADHVVRYTESDFGTAAREVTGGRGVDVVYDSVGRDTFEGSLGCLRPRGLLVLYGQSSGPVPAFDLNRLNTSGSLFVTRPSLFHYVREREELEERAGAVLDAVASGALRVRVDAEYRLGEAAEAHRALEERRTAGKLLLIP
ncbi:MAG: quinone oxidoreductase [Gemmatimonadota bacterium]|nr:MAG: quinone oxidoreductase [Gemmatimonadota bacterium]